eukprot:TRINITY_DN12140_c0_g1_i1.p1 TRINITY_DN12140_c0_g1~~TRINITY_DN12140_c0_g1_i1.p1  ORF type:complete len:142 (+),score=24.48 TRINITY_DN12140_c0_g1_i1:123-548(+)
MEKLAGISHDGCRLPTSIAATAILISTPILYRRGLISKWILCFTYSFVLALGELCIGPIYDTGTIFGPEFFIPVLLLLLSYVSALVLVLQWLRRVVTHQLLFWISVPIAVYGTLKLLVVLVQLTLYAVSPVWYQPAEGRYF